VTTPVAPPESYAERKAREAAERGDTAKAAYWLRIKELVDAAPPLSQAQRTQLRILLTPAPAPARSA